MSDDEGAGAGALMDDDELALLEQEDAAAEDEAAGLSAAALKKIAERKITKEQREIQERRLAKLKELREEQAKRLAASSETNAEKKLDFLMQQAEVFTHFMGAGADKGSPMKGKGPAAAGKGGKRGRHAVSAEQEDQELVEEALAQTMGGKVLAQPRNITATLREYQMEGLNWMVNLHDNNISGILADEMGLGKTLQSISLLAYLREARAVTGPHLVLVPKSVLGNWYREFTKWCPSIKVLKCFGQDKETRLKVIKEELLGGDWDVVITTFETVCKERSAFKKFPWYYVVIDEAHRIKNENSVLSQTIRQLDSSYRLLLTGTPLQNNLHELWALLNFLMPDVFGSSDDFDNWFRPPGSAGAGSGAGGGRGKGASDAGSGDMEIIKRLHALIKPFLLRRLKRDVESSLLPKIETKLYIGLSAMQKKWYQNILWKDAGALNSLGVERVRLLNTLMQLRKVCNHPYLFDGAEPGPPYFDGPHLWENCGKLNLLNKLLPKLKASGSRCLIFCQMTRMLDILEDFCRLQAYQYCRIDGNTDSVDRDSAMDAYNAPDSSKFIFLLSTRAGGLGINLYTADVVILYDSDWNPQMDLQAMDRAHRIGQKKQVRVFRFVTDKTVEEKIVERAERKLFLDAVVIQQGRLAQQEKGLSKGELLSMVRFGADEIVKSGDAGTMTDEDVDKILAQSEARSKEATEKLKKEMAEQLGAVSLEDLLKSDTSKFLYSADDTAGGSSIGGGAGGVVISLPEREKRKVVYDEKEYYRTVMGVEQGTHKGRPPGPRSIRAPNMLDFQFYNQARIHELYAKDNDLNVRRRNLQLAQKDAEAGEKRERSEFVRMRREELKRPVSEGGAGIATTEEATAKAEEEWYNARGGPEALESAKLQVEMDSLFLSPEEEEERKALLAEGFSSWSKRDFKTFIASCEKFGRANRDYVIAEVVEVTDKSAEDVGKYFDTFWQRYAEIADYGKFMERIEKGEQKLKRREVSEQIIADKVGRYPDPYRSLVLPYGANKMVFMRGYTEEEDRFLVCSLNKYGFGSWDAIKNEIRRHEGFRFNWFIKSRSAHELAKRCEAIVRLLEKEAVEEGTGAGKELSSAGGLSRGRGRGRGRGMVSTRGVGRGRGRGRGRGGAAGVGHGDIMEVDGDMEGEEGDMDDQDNEEQAGKKRARLA